MMFRFPLLSSKLWCLCPVVLPTQPYQKRAAAMSRRRFAAGTHSDHMALLRAFQVLLFTADVLLLPIH